MAKALFHKGQRVYVKSVGTWALVEQVVPQWVKGVEEPLRVYYEVGLGRTFAAHELLGAEQTGSSAASSASEPSLDHWRILRLRAHWEFDGMRDGDARGSTFPVVVTDELDWGGWRVPKAEFDRAPDRIEFQARVIVNAMNMLRLTRDLIALGESGVELPDEVQDLIQRASEIHRNVYLDPHDPAFGEAFAAE